jgi:hypothetical protein
VGGFCAQVLSRVVFGFCFGFGLWIWFCLVVVVDVKWLGLFHVACCRIERGCGELAGIFNVVVDAKIFLNVVCAGSRIGKPRLFNVDYYTKLALLENYIIIVITLAFFYQQTKAKYY